MRKERAPWPECYYEETDPLKRRALLEEAIEKGEGEPAVNALRQKLWALRYGERTRKNAPPADGYVALWVTMSFRRKDVDSRFRARAAEKELSGMLVRLRIDSPEAGEEERFLVYRELVHAMGIYLSTCTEGSYNTQIFGLMRLKKERLIEKIVYDVYSVAYELPAKLGMEEKFEPLRRAAYEAFSDAYPDEVELLDGAIFGGGES